MYLKTIKARAPLRLGLAGGGTDVAPYCDLYGGYVLNATIDRYAYTTLTPSDDGKLHLYSSDNNILEIIDIDANAVSFKELFLLHEVYKYMMDNYNSSIRLPLKLTTFCDAPPGSGLGSSSTLVVSTIKAFVELFNLALDDYKIASIAFRIEREICGLQGGKQDQYSASFGGFNFMEFYSDRTVVNTMRVKDWVLSELESSLILYFTGVSRESANIIADQSWKVRTSSEETILAMHGIKNEALAMKESLLRCDMNGVIDSLRLGWESKKRTSDKVSSQMIDRIYDSAISSGALAGKVSGAGGGGFMLFYVPTERRMDVIRTLNEFDGVASNCHFTECGAQSWVCH